MKPWFFLLALASALPSCASAAERSWVPLGLSGGGGMFSPAFSPIDPDVMMINCDMSGAYITEDGGRHWRMINHAQLRTDTRCRPAFHPLERNTVFASSGGQLRVSRDCGRTFTPAGRLPGGLSGQIAINPADPNLMLAGTSGGDCCLSRDGGITWTHCPGPQGQVLGFHFARLSAGRVMFAATQSGIWRSDDSGRTWAEKTRGLPWKALQGFAGASNPSNRVTRLYCTVQSRNENGTFKGGVYRSTDGGETWHSAMGVGLNTETKVADQYAYAPVSQYRQILAADANPLTVYIFNTSTGFFPPHSDNVYRSDDGGDSWRETYFMDPRFKQYNLEPDYLTASTGQSYKGGENPFGVAICNSDPNRVLLVRNEAHLTTNGGKTWLNANGYPPPGVKPGPGSPWVCNGLVVTTTWHYYVDPFETNRHYIAYTDIGFARSTNAGQTWIWWDKDSWAPWRNTCYELTFDPDIPGKLWGAFSNIHDIPNDNIISERHGSKGPGGLCLSLDFGAVWKPFGMGLPLKATTSIVLDPRSPKDNRVLYAGVFEGGVYRSSDDGRTWTDKSSGLGAPENMRVSRVFLHRDGTLFAAVCAKRPGRGESLRPLGVGLYRSADQGDHWNQINASQPLLYTKDFSVDPRDSRRILLGACDAGRGDQSGGLYLTTDGGQSWRRIGREGPQTFGGYFHPGNPRWIYMTLTEGAPGPGLWLSRDDGQSWKPFTQFPFANAQRVEFAPGDDAHIYLTTFGASAWRGPVTPESE